MAKEEEGGLRIMAMVLVLVLLLLRCGWGQECTLYCSPEAAKQGCKVDKGCPSPKTLEPIESDNKPQKSTPWPGQPPLAYTPQECADAGGYWEPSWMGNAGEIYPARCGGIPRVTKTGQIVCDDPLGCKSEPMDVPAVSHKEYQFPADTSAAFIKGFSEACVAWKGSKLIDGKCVRRVYSCDFDKRRVGPLFSGDGKSHCILFSSSKKAD